MTVETGTLTTGTPYKDFVVQGAEAEQFSARLIGQELDVAWTGERGTTFTNLAEVQRLAGGPGSITSIKGFASDRLLALIEQNQFNPAVVERALRQSLGGTWKVEVTKQGQRYVVTATRTGG